MSDTKVDMPKVTQMLDAGWLVSIYKGPMGSYEVRARHPDPKRMQRTMDALVTGMAENKNFLRKTGMSATEAVMECDFHDGQLMTDEFTPEQALTRMAYKVFGEII